MPHDSNPVFAPLPGGREVWLGKLTRREFRERMASGELAAALVPVGATEQHLEHLAMEHDDRSCRLIAAEVARRLSPQVLVAPFASIGISEHHMRHAGTLSATPAAWLGMLHDTIRCLVDAGFRNILVLNGHGGNVAPCDGTWGQFLQRFEINLHFRSYWDFVAPEFVAAHLESQAFPGHAQEFETAVALAAFPENVRTDAVADQTDREPSLATAETGRLFLEEIVRHTADFVRAMIEGRQAAEIPDFF